MMRHKHIVAIGHDLAIASFLKWFRTVNIRTRLTLVTDSKVVGVPRYFLPYIATGLYREDSVPHMPLSYIGTVLATQVVECDPASLRIDPEKIVARNTVLHFDALVVSTGTKPDPRFSRWVSASAVTLKDALVARETIENWEGEVFIFGGFEGLGAVDALEQAGLQPVLCADSDPFSEVFDEDVAAMARRLIKPLSIHVPGEPPRNQGLAFGFEVPAPPTGLELPRDLQDFKVSSNVYVLGSIAKIRTELGVLMAFSDECAYKEGLVLALRLNGLSLKLPPPCRVVSVRGYILCACGLTVSKASEKGISTSSVKLTLKACKGVSGVLKITASRSPPRLLGFQCVAPKSEYSNVALLYSLLALGITPDNLYLVPQFLGGDDIPAVKAIEALWRKLALK